MRELDTLQQLLTRLPGIGPRQGRRFAYFLMRVSQDYIDELIDSLTTLRKSKSHCPHCNALYFRSNTHHDNTCCPICADETREASRLLIVARQADVETIEQAGSWRGHYFILGRTVRLSDKNPESVLPLALLRQRLTHIETEEIIMGLPVNSEGAYTEQTLEDALQDLTKEDNITISRLGRGLSLGAELEYSDPETVAAALKHRF